jgi:hypothetical protein
MGDTPAQRTPKSSSSAPDYRAFTVVKREGKDKSDYWLDIGAAFAHEDGEGFNVLLHALPIDGKIVLRTIKDNEDKPAHK